MAKGDYGYNGRVSNKGMGARKVRILQISFPLNIVASSDNEARSRRAFYPSHTDTSEFTLVLGFINWAEREAFNKWMSRFMTNSSEGALKYGFMTVVCPARNFTRIGVPQGNVEYGEALEDMVYTLQLVFVGAKDPLDASLDAKMTGTKFLAPGKNQTSRHFYPGGLQVSGAEAADGAIYDSSATDAMVMTPAEAQAINVHSEIDDQRNN